MLLGITKQNVMRKGRYYFSDLRLIFHFPKNACHVWETRTKAALRPLRVDTKKRVFSRLYRYIDIYRYMLHVNLLKGRNLIGSLSRDIGQYPMIEISNLGYCFHSKMSANKNK